MLLVDLLSNETLKCIYVPVPIATGSLETPPLQQRPVPESFSKKNKNKITISFTEKINGIPYSWTMDSHSA